MRISRVTSKACAGLNGMMLGGQVLTAVLATPEPVLKNAGELPTYVIPNHAKPLIRKPTAILKLKNVLDPEGLVSLSESEIEEILEDIRLECSRFGMVRSVNVVRKTNVFSTTVANEIENASACTDAHNSHVENKSRSIEQVTKSTSGVKELENCSQMLEDMNGCDNIPGSSDTVGGSVELKEISRFVLVSESTSNENFALNIMKDEVCELPSNGQDVSVEELQSQSKPGDSTGEFGNQRSTSDVELVSSCSNPPNTEDLKSAELSTEKTLMSEELNARSASSNASNVELDTVERNEPDAEGEGERKDVSVDLAHVFEPGSVIVEYRRPEAACMAAHCLHGRTFDGRVVTVEYVGHDHTR